MRIFMLLGTLLALAAPARAQYPGKVLPENNPFEHIFEYTLSGEKLPDGKHPVWMYYAGKDLLIKVIMPSLEMCVITSASEADLGIIRSRNLDEIPEQQWDMPMQIWQAAFDRDILVHDRPQLCR